MEANFHKLLIYIGLLDLLLCTMNKDCFSLFVGNVNLQVCGTTNIKDSTVQTNNVQ